MTNTAMNETSENFLWGVATSAHQIEGQNIHSDWWHWEQQGNIEGGARSGMACDHLHHYQADIKLIAEMGCNSYRFSIEWARVEPECDVWNEEAFGFYRNILQECQRYQIQPMLTLLHFTLPNWLALQGGVLAKDSTAYFARFVRKVAEKLGPDIQLWCTLNEPMVMASGAYLAGFMPPAEINPGKTTLAIRKMLLWHVTAYDLLHQILGENIRVGFAHNMIHFLPHRRWHLLERIATFYFAKAYNWAWLDAACGKKQDFAIPSLLKNIQPLTSLDQTCKTDFIGVNYYTRAYIQWRPRTGNQALQKQFPFGISFCRKSDKASDLGWAIDALGFKKILKKVARYQLPIYITENGIADREDSLRSDYLKEHLKILKTLKTQGLKICGYYHWSLLDNFEWIKGFWPRFGLYAVNYDTQKRQERASAQVYRQLIHDNLENSASKSVQG